MVAHAARGGEWSKFTVTGGAASGGLLGESCRCSCLLGI
jgi:hypothetical protein